MNRDYLGPTTSKPVDLPSPPAPASREAIAKPEKLFGDRRWFVYDGGSGFFLFETEDEARAEVLNWLELSDQEFELSGKYDWSEQIGNMCWGRICGEVVLESTRFVPGLVGDVVADVGRYRMVEVKGE